MSWLHSVYFLNQNHGWVAGSGGVLLETGNGGQTWRKLYTLTKDTLRDVYFADEKNGWLLCERDSKETNNDGPRAYLLKTSDGGLSWGRINLAGADVNARFTHAVFANAERGWVFGESGVVLVTNDGGAHWIQQALPTRHLLLGGAFIDGTRGWLVGASATILQTNDGGMSWHAGEVRGATTRFAAASFVSTNRGWVVGAGGGVFATNDGGLTWLAQQSNVEADLMDVKFIDGDGWAVGSEGVLLHTTNGGAHWSLESSGTTHALERLFFVDHNHGWAVGFGGTILSLSETSKPQLRN